MQRSFCMWFLSLVVASTGCSADLDMFLIAGQSNAVGQGISGNSPRVWAGMCWQWKGDHLVPANDPVGGANTGSAWPAFCRAYTSATRRSVLVVPAAVNGTAQCTAADKGYGNWDIGGALVPAALTALSSATAAATAAGWAPVFRGTIWCQGEADADALRLTKITVPQYKAALLAMASRLQVAPNAMLYLIRSGDTYAGSDPWMAQIRQAQDDVSAYNWLTHQIAMVYRGTRYYKTYGMLRSDGHYLQQGLNVMGRYTALGILADGIPNTWVCTGGYGLQFEAK